MHIDVKYVVMSTDSLTQGRRIIPSVTPPQWLLTPDNAPDTSKIFPIVPDVVQQFETLWGVS